MGQKILDPDIDDSSRWVARAGYTGSYSVTGSQLILTGFDGIIDAGSIAAIVGGDYKYSIDVDSYTSGFIVVYYGNAPIWTGLMGTGVFSGDIEATDIDGLVIATAFGSVTATINRVSIMAGGGISLYDSLAGHAGLGALIGNGDSPETFRIYPMVMPQDPTLPAIVYQNIIGTRLNTLSDAGGSGVERNLYQLTAWATTYSEANNVIEQARLALKAADINYIPQSNSDMYEPETKLFGIQYDFAQWYRA